MNRSTLSNSPYARPSLTGSQGSACPHTMRTGTSFGIFGRSSSGRGPPLYDMKSRNTSAAPGWSPGFRMHSTSSSVTASGFPYASFKMFFTVSARATFLKNFWPMSVVLRVFCRIATNGLMMSGCFVMCSPRREGLMRTTPRHVAGASTAACKPATPPTELHMMNAGSPTISSMKALSCLAQFSKL